MNRALIVLAYLGAPAIPTLALAQDDGPKLEPAAPPATAPSKPPTPPPAESATPGVGGESPGVVDAVPERPPGASELRKRFELAARLAYGRAIGGGASNVFQIAAHVPVVIEAGYRVTPRLSVLVGLQYAALFRNGCVDGRSCGGRALKGTGTIVYHFKPGAPFEPWFGYSMGYESIQLNGPLQYEVRNAFELMNLQLGADWQLNDATAPMPLRLGPFASISVDMPISSAVRRASAHSWISLGVRGTWDL
jgi:hypothetical protein